MQVLAPGSRLGPYDIQALVGQGGMGEVYRATDARLKRNVALKVLPQSFASDPDRLARFEREAQVLASLNHPHIAGIYGIEESNGTRALVMELVDGPTLADRIAQGPIPLDEALPIARQITEALDAAHEAGIIHRDLKPANIKLRPDGTVKVLDFGLAKVMESAAPAAALSNSPTFTSPAMMTHAGVILGTAAYMSPEQARGKTVDRRTDIWAFGCVLFEMLTGTRAFPGEDVSETLACVLRGEPEWSRLPPGWPQLAGLVRHCLTKDPRGRPSSIAVAAYLLTHVVAEKAPAHVPRRGWITAAALLGALALVGTVVAGTLWFRSVPVAEPIRFAVPLTGTTALSFAGPAQDVGISPDGRLLVYVTADGPADSQAMLRQVDQLDAVSLKGAQPASSPFFSPDGRWLVFTSPGVLRKTLIDGGTPTPLVICRLVGLPVGGTWTRDQMIIFATSDPATGLIEVSAEGGEPKALTTPDASRGEVDHLSPSALPDGRGVLFTIKTGAGRDDSNIGFFDRESGEYRVILRAGSHPHYVAPGYLVFGSGDRLNAVRFDAARGEVQGAPFPVVEPVAAKFSGAVEYAVSQTGTLVYLPTITASGGGARILQWVDRQGRETPLDAPPRPYVYARLAPGGRRIALDIRDQQSDIWLWDSGRLTRLTSAPSIDGSPVWSPDGQHVIYSSARGGAANLYLQPADPNAEVKRVSSSVNAQLATSFTPDGRIAIFNENASAGGAGLDLMLLSVTDGAVSPLLQTPFNESNGDVSPDGRYIAYQSDESGEPQVYVRTFPKVNGGVWQVSKAGGHRPRWSPTNRELFFFDAAGVLMGVPVEFKPDFRVGSPVKVVDAGYYAGSGAVSGRTYDVSGDGSRFLMLKDVPQQQQTTAQMIVVLNWLEEVKRQLSSRSP